MSQLGAWFLPDVVEDAFMLVCGEEGEDVVALRVQDGHRHLVVVLLHHRRRVERRQRVLQANTKRLLGLKTNSSIYFFQKVHLIKKNAIQSLAK